MPVTTQILRPQPTNPAAVTGAVLKAILCWQEYDCQGDGGEG
jgi:hypothetical protein